MIFPKNTVYVKVLNDLILRFAASGLDLKISSDMAWDLQRSDTQNLLASTKSKTFSMADVVERKLNLADTEGMFLLMAIGYILAGSVLFSEIVDGCARSCRAFVRRNSNVADIGRRGSEFSQSQEMPVEPKTFSDKLKTGIRMRLRSKPKPEKPEVPKERVSDSKEPDESRNVGTESGLKASISFNTIKRIMMMRKNKKDEKEKTKKEAKDETTDVVIESNEDPMESHFGNYLDFEERAIGDEQVTIENEKIDGDNLTGSSSYSETQMITGEIEVELNHLTVSDRENNPSKEFGEVV